MTINIDFKETKAEVVKILKRYKKLLHIVPVRSMPSITSSFSFIAPDTSYRLNAIESTAEKNIQREKLLKERAALANSIHQAIDCLLDDEKYIIVNNFLQIQKGVDYDIYTDLGIGKTKYYELKKNAIVQLAMYLGIEKYKID